MNDYLTIRFGIGLGDLKFGASRYEVIAYLGEPDKHDDAPSPDLWHYGSIGLSVSFDEDEEYKLDGFETDHPHASLWGHEPFGMKKAEILRLFEEKGMSISEEEQDPDSTLRITFDDCGCNLWFEDGDLDTVQWGALFDEAGDNILWPE